MQLNSNKRELDEKIESTVSERSNLEDSVLKIDDNITRAKLHLKQVEQQLSEKKDIVEHHMLEEAEDAFKAYLEEQAGTFDAITRTYGVKVMDELLILILSIFFDCVMCDLSKLKYIILIIFNYLL